LLTQQNHKTLRSVRSSLCPFHIFTTMKNLATLLNRTLLLAAMPAAALVFSGCGDDDPDPAPVAPDQGRVMLVHASASSNIPVKFVANDNKELGQLNYGTSSNYTSILSADQSIKINNASSGATVATQTLKVEKDKSYSVFAYSPTTNIGSVAALGVTDDLTPPATGKAKVRFVNLGTTTTAPVAYSLSIPGPQSGTVDIIPNVAFGTASPFVELTPQTYNLTVSTGTGATGVVKVYVGDGTGTGTNTSTRNYVAGKIYTVVLRGIDSQSIDAALQLKATVIENN
jgi:hypothetical protein